MSLLILFIFGKFNEKVACLQLNLWQLYEVRIDVVFNLRYNFYVYIERRTKQRGFDGKKL